MRFLIFVFLFNSFAAAAELKINEFDSPFRGSSIYAPNDGKAHPGVIMLHGSEGGSLPYATREAQFLAAHRYAVLSYCWYNCAKNPIKSPHEPLENIEVRKIIDAIKAFKSSTHVAGGKIAVLGWSRGAELGILLGSLDESIALLDAIAVHTPSDVVVSGFNWSANDQRCWICVTFDLKCFNGSEDFNKWDWPNIKWNYACGAYPKLPDSIQSWLLDGRAIPHGKVIEIEKFKKPVFITVGDKDEMWDYRKSVRIKERLEQFAQPIELHIFPGEYHNFSHANENERHRLLLNFLERVLAHTLSEGH